MSGSLPRQTSLRQRTRYWTTLACVLAGMSGLLTMLAGHSVHGALLLLAGLVLVKGSIWGRRGKRHAGSEPVAPGSAESANSRKWRKAA